MTSFLSINKELDFRQGTTSLQEKKKKTRMLLQVRIILKKLFIPSAFITASPKTCYKELCFPEMFFGG